MTYRERRLARAERLRGWAEKRVARANADLTSQPDLRNDWAFITQPGHIPERARMNARDDRAFRSLDKADRMASRADGIERAAANAIYSDDPDAVDALTAKIARLEAERARIVAYNRAVRKAGKVTNEALALLDAKGRADVMGLAKIGMLRPDGALPGYVTSNISGNLSRLRARLSGLERA
jgi:Domain of unknown function (DUF3560)